MKRSGNHWEELKGQELIFFPVNNKLRDGEEVPW